MGAATTGLLRGWSTYRERRAAIDRVNAVEEPVAEYLGDGAADGPCALEVWVVRRRDWRKRKHKPRNKDKQAGWEVLA